MILRNRRLDQLLGGRWAISLRGSIAILPFVVLAAPLGNSVGVKNFLFAQWTYISFLSTLPPLGIFILLNFTIYKNRSSKPLSWWWIVLVGGSLGLLKGFLMSLIGYKSGLVTDSFIRDMERRMFNNFLLGVSLLPLVAFIAAGYERYSIQRNRMLRQALAKNSLANELMSEKQAVERGVDRRVSDKIERDLSQTRAVLIDLMELGSEIDGFQVAKYLRNRARTSIRPLSHVLFNDSGNEVGIRRFRTAVQWGIANLMIYPEVVLGAFGITTIASHYDQDPFFAATSRFVIHLLVLAGLLNGIRAVNNRFHIRNLLYKLVLMILLVVLFELLSSLVMGLSQLRVESIPSQIAGGFWVFFLTVTLSAVNTIFTREEALLESLRSLITDEEIRFAGSRIASSRAGRDLARYLHSNLQTALLNAANVIEHAAQVGDRSLVYEEVSKVQNLLHLPGTHEITSASLTLDASLRASTRNWEGLMKIHRRLTGTSKDGTETEAKKVGLVLDEALSNAFRHGKASNVNITLAASKETLKISVIDDGIGPTGGMEGMGSQTFDSIGGPNWSLNPGNNGGAQFSLRIDRN